MCQCDEYLGALAVGVKKKIEDVEGVAGLNKSFTTDICMCNKKYIDEPEKE